MNQLGKDVQLGHFRSQYQALAHLWLALHAHRRVDIKQSALIKLHSDAACRILKNVIGTSNHKSTRKSLPKLVAPSKKTLGPSLSRLRSKRITVSQKRDPVTPKPKAKKGNHRRNRAYTVPNSPLDLHLFSPKTPPQSADPVTMVIPFDDFQGLLSLIRGSCLL